MAGYLQHIPYLVIQPPADDHSISPAIPPRKQHPGNCDRRMDLRGASRRCACHPYRIWRSAAREPHWAPPTYLPTYVCGHRDRGVTRVFLDGGFAAGRTKGKTSIYYPHSRRIGLLRCLLFVGYLTLYHPRVRVLSTGVVCRCGRLFVKI